MVPVRGREEPRKEPTHGTRNRAIQGDGLRLRRGTPPTPPRLTAYAKGCTGTRASGDAHMGGMCA